LERMTPAFDTVPENGLPPAMICMPVAASMTPPAALTMLFIPVVFSTSMPKAEALMTPALEIDPLIVAVWVKCRRYRR